jgi:hypothetical protein
MKDAPGGRSIYIPRGRNPLEDLNILADCIAASDADLFNQDEGAIWITAGKRVPVNPNTLREICKKYVVTKHPRETAGGWEVAFRPYEPDEMTLRALLTAKTQEEGGLIWRLPKGQSEPRKLSERQREEVYARLKIGEPKEKLAREYGVPVDAIRVIGR